MAGVRADPDLPPGPARDLVDLFRQLRRSPRLSGGQIAIRTGLSASHVSEVLRGWKAPSPAAAGKIAAALGGDRTAVARAVRLAEELGELNRHRRQQARAGRPAADREAPRHGPGSTPAGRSAPPAGSRGAADGEEAGTGDAAIAAGPSPPRPLQQVNAWPHRVGVVPARAQCLRRRPEADALRACLAAMPGQGAREPAFACVLAGLGGVGKTQLAAACAEEMAATGLADLLIWITASSGAAIQAALAQAAAEVTGIDDQDAAHSADRMLAWLATTGRRWLVVIDDLAAPADLAGLWPPATQAGRTIVTTRRRDASLAGPGRVMLDVGLFSADDAAGYLEERLAARPRLLTEARQLAADLGFLPLALAQASTYLLDRDLSCAQYRARLADRRASLGSLLPEADALPDAHRQTVAAAWSLSVDLADRLAPAGLARPLLELASVLDTGGWPVGVLTTAAARGYLALAAARSGRRRAGDVTVADARDGLHCLARLSLVSLDADDAARAVRVHSLVQRAIRDAIPADLIGRTVTSAADALEQAWPPVERDPQAGQALRACAEALAVHYQDVLCADGIHPVLLHAGRSLGESGAPAAAAAYFGRLLAAAGQALPEHPDVMTARHELLRWRGEAGDPDGAVAGYESLLADRRRLLGPDHPDTLTTRGNLASWRGRAGDVAGAIAGLEDLLPDLTRILGAEHPHALAARHNLAYWRGEAGDPAGAAAGFAELVADLTRIAGPDQPETLNARSSLAWWRGEAGDPAGAAAAYQDLLADRLRVLGPDHRQIALTRHNLAYWRGEAGDPAGAAAAFRDLLADRLRTLGPDHPYTLNARSELARWQGMAGDPRAAVAALELLLADRLRGNGPDDPDTLTTRHNLARWRHEAGQDKAAAAELRSLLADQRRVLGDDHPATRATLCDLAALRAGRRAADRRDAIG